MRFLPRHIITALLISILSGVTLPPYASAELPASRFSGFWRNFYATKASWPLSAWEQMKFDYALGMMGIQASMMIPVPGISPLISMGIMGKLDQELNTMANALIYMQMVPLAPQITAVAREGAGVKVRFQPAAADWQSVSDGVSYLKNRYYTLFFFSDSRTVPRVVTSVNSSDGIDNDNNGFYLNDLTPPTSGTGFYAMTCTISRQNTPSTPALKPWWMYQDQLSSNASSYWDRLSQGVTSDYSAPFPYIAGPLPDTGDIKTIAVEPLSGDVYLSKPSTTQILKMSNTNGGLSDPVEFVNTSFKAPGQTGLAVDSSSTVYTDNAASDSQYGGRLFRFFPNGVREFTGTVNYFSQLLMYANPVSVGHMTFGPNKDLLVSEELSRQIRRVPVNATYDPYRRVGLIYFALPASRPGPVIDMEYHSSTGNLFLMDGYGITVVPYNQAADSAGTANWNITNIPLE